jgi:hypothetical protein
VLGGKIKGGEKEKLQPVVSESEYPRKKSGFGCVLNHNLDIFICSNSSIDSWSNFDILLVAVFLEFSF